MSNVAISNESVLIQLGNYVQRMLMITAGNSTMSYNKRGNESFYESLENKERLQDLEDFLNA